MITYFTAPGTLAEALHVLAERMERVEERIGHVALANMMSAVLDGPGHTAWTPTEHPELARKMQDAIVPDGFLSPVPTAGQVRQAADAARSS